jgi:hypothetical protein
VLMNAKTICLLLLTCILVCTLSVGGFFVVSQLIEQRNSTVMLVVAKHDYPKGTIITDPEQMFELREFLDSDAPPDHVSDLDDRLRDLVLRNDIHEGQPLQYSNLEISKGPTNRLKHVRRGGELLDLVPRIDLDSPGPGRKYLLIMAKAREHSIRVGTRVDVIQRKSKEDPKAETIVLHDVLVRHVEPAKFPQEMLEKHFKDGKTDLVTLAVVLDVSDAEGAQFVDKDSGSILVELRPSADNKKVDEKNSPKIP